MAYIRPINEEDPNNPKPLLRGGAVSEPIVIGQSTGQPKQQGGSQFADISRYLSQNVQAGRRLGEKIGGQIAEQGNQARQALTTGEQGFNKAVSDATIGLNKDVLNRAVYNPTSIVGYKQPAPVVPQGTPIASQPLLPGQVPNKEPGKRNLNLITQQGVKVPQVGNRANKGNPSVPAPKPDLTPQVLDQSAFDAFRRMQGANYEGPQTFEGSQYYEPAAQNLANIAKTQSQLQTDQGRRDLLGGLVASPRYSIGAQGLDALLLGNQQSQGALTSAQQGLSDIAPKLAAISQLAKETAGKGKETTENTRFAVNSLFQGIQNPADRAKLAQILGIDTNAILPEQAAYNTAQSRFDEISKMLAQAKGAGKKAGIPPVDVKGLRREQAQLEKQLPGLKTGAEQSSQNSLLGLAGRGGVQNIFQSDLDKRVGEQQMAASRRGQAVTSFLNRVQKAQEDGTNLPIPNKTQLADMGLSEKAWNRIMNISNELRFQYGVNKPFPFTDYLQNLPVEMQVNRENVANLGDYEKMAALSQLLGQNQTSLTDPTQAGKFSLDVSDFQKGDVEQRLLDLLNQYRTQTGQMAYDKIGDYRPSAVNYFPMQRSA